MVKGGSAKSGVGAKKIGKNQLTIAQAFSAGKQQQPSNGVGTGKEKHTCEEVETDDDVTLTNTTIGSANTEPEVIDLENEPPFSMQQHMKAEKRKREKLGLGAALKQSRLHHLPPDPDALPDPDQLAPSSNSHPASLLEDQRQKLKRDLALLAKFRNHGKESKQDTGLGSRGQERTDDEGKNEAQTPTGGMSLARFNLKQVFKLDSFRPLQEDAVRAVLKGHDVMMCLATGGGKSLCYQLPATVFPGLTVVVSPLIALMEDQVEGLRQRGVSVELLNSNLTSKQYQNILARLQQKELPRGERRESDGKSESSSKSFGVGAIKLLYVTPEALAGEALLPHLEKLNKSGLLAMFAVDEAHCISSWGHDFRPAFCKLGNLKRKFPNVPMMALTATASRRVRDDIISTLKLNNPKVLIASFNRPNIRYEVRYKELLHDGDVEADIVQFLRRSEKKSGIIYCHKRSDCSDVAHALQLNGFSAEAYHGGMKADERSDILSAWSSGAVDIVVATIAFGMGIDKADVRFVIHYTVPKSMEGFYQESGRAGRDGEQAVSLLYYSLEDKSFHEHLAAGPIPQPATLAA